MTILCNSKLVTTTAGLGLVEGGAVVIGGETVSWAGQEGALPAFIANRSGSASICAFALSPQISMPNGCSGSPARDDIAIWDVLHPAELSCWRGASPLHTRVFGGQLDA